MAGGVEVFKLHLQVGEFHLDLGDDWLRAMCWENGVRIFGEGRR